MMTKHLLFRRITYLLLVILLFSVPLMAQNNTASLLNFGKKQLTVQAIIDKLKTGYGYKVSFDDDVNLSKTINLPNETISLGNLETLLQRQADLGLKNIDGNLI